MRKSNTTKEAAALGNLGIAYGSFGQYEQAIDDREKSLAIDRQIKHRQGEATSLNNIASVSRQLQPTEKAINKYQGGQYLVGCGWFSNRFILYLYYQEKQETSRSQALRKAQFKLRKLTGDEFSAKYKRQLEDYFEQQQEGEQQAEIVKNVRLRLDLLCRQELPFVSPYNWAGFVSQGLA